MTAGELRIFDTSKLKVVLVCIVLAVVASGVVFVAVTSHAVEKHGAALTDAGSQCFDNHGSMKRMNNPITGRNADICFEGMFYVNITEANGDPVTIFPKEKLASLDEVIQYLIRVGYQ